MYYIDTSVAFGARGGALACSRLSDAIRYIHTNNGYHLCSYIDDLMSADPAEVAECGYYDLCTLLENVNIPVSVSKLVSPCTRMVCLGIEVDSIEQTL